MKQLSLVLVGLFLATTVITTTSGIGAGETPRKLRIIYTNDLTGYLEPCGCGGHHIGGLAKRATVFTQLKKEEPDCIIVDSGNLSNSPDKLSLIASVMADLGYDAVGIGSNDTVMTKDLYKAFSGVKVPVLFAGAQPDSSTVPYVVKKANGVRVGVISFGGLPPNVKANDVDVLKSLYSAYRKARSESDVLILLNQGNIVTPEWIERNARRFGAPDVVIGGTMQTTLTKPQICGTTYIVQTAMQAKSVGVVDVEFSKGMPPKLTAKMVPLDDGVQPDAKVAKYVKDYMNDLASKFSVYSGTSAKAAQPASRITGAVIPAADKPYYSAEQCKACHAKQYEDWKASDHAKAISDLAEVNRAIPECMSCHSEAYRRTPNVVESKKIDMGVECATCHIDSLPHGMERKNVTAKAKVDSKMCLNCHTKEWSPDYNEKVYWSKIAHIGMDTAKVVTSN